MTTASEHHDAQINAMKERHQAIRDKFADPKISEIEIGSDVRLNQMGLQLPYVDELGRFWRIEQTTARLVFDPSWLHPEQRWYPDEETLRAHHPDAQPFMGFDLGDAQWTEAEAEAMRPSGLIHELDDEQRQQNIRTLRDWWNRNPHNPTASVAQGTVITDEMIKELASIRWAPSLTARDADIHITEPAAPAIQGETMTDEQDTEKKIVAAGAVAPRLTPDLINSKIKGADYYRFPGTTLTVCALTLANGFQVTGESAATSPENFREEIGREIAYTNARAKIWALEGYLLKERLSNNADPAAADPTDTQAANGNPAHE